jgi:hypothetical protein
MQPKYHYNLNILITLENTKRIKCKIRELIEGKDNISRFIKVINRDTSSLANRNLFLYGHNCF